MSAKVTVLDERAKLKAFMARRMVKSIEEAAAYVYKVARNSIRRSKKSSEPGMPPHTRQGVLKRPGQTR